MVKSRVGGAAIALVALVGVGVAVVACGGGGDGGEQPRSQATAGDGSQADGGDASGGTAIAAGTAEPSARSGTLSVDGQEFKFRVFFCGFTPAQTGTSNVPFSFRGNGVNPEGRTFSVGASIVEGPGGATHSVSMWYDDSNTVIVYASEAAAPAEGQIVIDGKQISYEADFTGLSGPIGIGTLKATCP